MSNKPISEMSVDDFSNLSKKDFEKTKKMQEEMAHARSFYPKEKRGEIYKRTRPQDL